MQERQVTIGHDTYPVPEPFLVMATQNPIESEGTYPLPEAQVDRFMLKVLVDYPEHDEELTVVQRSLVPPPELAACSSSTGCAAPAARRPSTSTRHRQLRRALATATRQPARYGLADLAPFVAFGASPRGPINLVQSARALAFLRGRDYVVPQDVERSPRTRSATGSCSPTRGWPSRSTPTRSSTPCSRRCGARARPRAGGRRPLDDRPRGPRVPPHAGPPGPRAAPRAAPARARPDVGRRIEGLLAGDHRSTLLGAGTELAQVRPYVPGDDVRRIDWNVTARTGEPHVRVHVAERALVTWLVLDVSASMAFGTADRRKADVAEGVALAVGHSRAGAATGSGSSPSATAPAGDPAAAGPGRAARPAARAAPRAGAEGGGATRSETRSGSSPGGAAALARRDRLRLPRAARLAAAAAPARRPPRRARGRDPRPARGDPAERGRAAARRSRDGPPAARRHRQPRLRERFAPRPPPSAPRSRSELRRSASATSCSRPRATGCARSPVHLRRREGAGELRLAARAAAAAGGAAGGRRLPRCSSGGGAAQAARSRTPRSSRTSSGAARAAAARAPALVLLALAALASGLARPHATLSVKREEATVVLAIDTSRSMAANDVPPTRLAAAQAAVRASSRSCPTAIGSAWSRSRRRAQVVLPATANREAAHRALRNLRTGDGTALGDGIARAVKVAQRVRSEREQAARRPRCSSSRTARRPRAARAARRRPRAQKLGIPIYTVAFGTPNGVVEIVDDPGFTQRMTVPPDPPTLRQVAQLTGGRFYAAPDARA